MKELHPNGKLPKQQRWYCNECDRYHKESQNFCWNCDTYHPITSACVRAAESVWPTRQRDYAKKRAKEAVRAQWLKTLAKEKAIEKWLYYCKNRTAFEATKRRSPPNPFCDPFSGIRIDSGEFDELL
jgi:hypothetical protein